MDRTDFLDTCRDFIEGIAPYDTDSSVDEIVAESAVYELKDLVKDLPQIDAEEKEDDIDLDSALETVIEYFRDWDRDADIMSGSELIYTADNEEFFDKYSEQCEDAIAGLLGEFGSIADAVAYSVQAARENMAIMGIEEIKEQIEELREEF